MNNQSIEIVYIYIYTIKEKCFCFESLLRRGSILENLIPTQEISEFVRNPAGRTLTSSLFWITRGYNIKSPYKLTSFLIWVNHLSHSIEKEISLGGIKFREEKQTYITHFSKMHSQPIIL